MKIKFIDSFNFLAMALAKFPATFQLTELKKGYFPHLFNVRANQQHRGPIPVLHYYTPDSLPTTARTKLIEWHRKQEEINYLFDMQVELREYCTSDVTILWQGWEKFCAMCFGMFFLDPLLECITLASYCLIVYRTHHMPKDSIAIIPQCGYGGRAKQSIKAIHWLQWVQTQTPGHIRHARNGGEYKVSSYFKSVHVNYVIKVLIMTLLFLLYNFSEL